MTKEEVQAAYDAGKSMVVDVLGVKFVGKIREFGMLNSKMGPGSVQRACVIVETDNGDVYSHINNLSIATE